MFFSIYAMYALHRANTSSREVPISQQSIEKNKYSSSWWL